MAGTREATIRLKFDGSEVERGYDRLERRTRSFSRLMPSTFGRSLDQTLNRAKGFFSRLGRMFRDRGLIRTVMHAGRTIGGSFVGAITRAIRSGAGAIRGGVLRSLRVAGGATSAFGGALGGLAGPLGLIGGAGVIGGAATLGSAVMKGVGFEDMVARIKAVSPDAVKHIKTVVAAAKELGKTTRYTSTEAASGILVLQKAGLGLKDSLVTLPDVLRLAAAGEVDIASAAEIGVSAMIGFQKEASELTGVMDQLAIGTTKFKTDLPSMGSAMSTAAPAMTRLNQSVSTTVTLLGALAQVGREGSTAGIALEAVTRQLTKGTSLINNILKQAGVDVGNAKDGFRDLIVVFEELQGSLDAGKIGLGQINQLFGEEGARAFFAYQAAAAKTGGTLRGVRAEIEGADGVLERMAKTMEDTLGGSMRSLTSAIEAVMLNLVGAGGEGGVNNALKTWLNESIIPAVRHIAAFVQAAGGLVGMMRLLWGTMKDVWGNIGSIMMASLELIGVGLIEVVTVVGGDIAEAFVDAFEKSFKTKFASFWKDFSGTLPYLPDALKDFGKYMEAQTPDWTKGTPQGGLVDQGHQLRGGLPARTQRVTNAPDDPLAQMNAVLGSIPGASPLQAGDMAPFDKKSAGQQAFLDRLLATREAFGKLLGELKGPSVEKMQELWRETVEITGNYLDLVKDVPDGVRDMARKSAAPAEQMARGFARIWQDFNRGARDAMQALPSLFSADGEDGQRIIGQVQALGASIVEALHGGLSTAFQDLLFGGSDDEAAIERALELMRLLREEVIETGSNANTQPIFEELANLSINDIPFPTTELQMALAHGMEEGLAAIEDKVAWLRDQGSFKTKLKDFFVDAFAGAKQAAKQGIGDMLAGLTMQGGGAIVDAIIDKVFKKGDQDLRSMAVGYVESAFSPGFTLADVPVNLTGLTPTVDTAGAVASVGSTIRGAFTNAISVTGTPVNLSGLAPSVDTSGLAGSVQSAVLAGIGPGGVDVTGAGVNLSSLAVTTDMTGVDDIVRGQFQSTIFNVPGQVNLTPNLTVDSPTEDMKQDFKTRLKAFIGEVGFPASVAAWTAMMGGSAAETALAFFGAWAAQEMLKSIVVDDLKTAFSQLIKPALKTLTGAALGVGIGAALGGSPFEIALAGFGGWVVTELGKSVVSADLGDSLLAAFEGWGKKIAELLGAEFGTSFKTYIQHIGLGASIAGAMGGGTVGSIFGGVGGLAGAAMGGPMGMAVTLGSGIIGGLWERESKATDKKYAEREQLKAMLGGLRTSDILTQLQDQADISIGDKKFDLGGYKFNLDRHPGVFGGADLDDFDAFLTEYLFKTMRDRTQDVMEEYQRLMDMSAADKTGYEVDLQVAKVQKLIAEAELYPVGGGPGMSKESLFEFENFIGILKAAGEQTAMIDELLKTATNVVPLKKPGDPGYVPPGDPSIEPPAQRTVEDLLASIESCLGGFRTDAVAVLEQINAKPAAAFDPAPIVGAIDTARNGLGIAIMGMSSNLGASIGSGVMRLAEAKGVLVTINDWVRLSYDRLGGMIGALFEAKTAMLQVGAGQGFQNQCLSIIANRTSNSESYLRQLLSLATGAGLKVAGLASGSQTVTVTGTVHVDHAAIIGYLEVLRSLLFNLFVTMSSNSSNHSAWLPAIKTAAEAANSKMEDWNTNGLKVTGDFGSNIDLNKLEIIADDHKKSWLAWSSITGPWGMAHAETHAVLVQIRDRIGDGGGSLSVQARLRDVTNGSSLNSVNSNLAIGMVALHGELIGIGANTKRAADLTEGLYRLMMAVGAQQAGLMTPTGLNIVSQYVSQKVGEAGAYQLDGFAGGGDFTVGGSGGTDSQIVSFRATPGEHVSITTPGQSGGGDTYEMHFHIGAGASQADVRKVEQELAPMVRRVMMRESRRGKGMTYQNGIEKKRRL